jgi:hypothetical protein
VGINTVSIFIIIPLAYFIIDFFFCLISGPRLRITILEDDPMSLSGGLRFEIENIGDELTELHPLVRSTFLTAGGERYDMIFDVHGTDLFLPPYIKKCFEASARQLQLERIHGQNKHYCFDHGDGAAIEIMAD